MSVAAGNSLLRRARVFQDVHVDEECLLVLPHAAQQERPLLQQPYETQSW